MASPNAAPPFSLPRFSPAVAQLATFLALATAGAGVLVATTTTHQHRRAAAATTRRAAVATARSSAHDRVAALPRSAPPSPTAHAASSAHLAPRRADDARRRWLPRGTGIWIYQWNRTNRGNADAVVARAREAHLSTLYVRTGSSRDGFRGVTVLRALLAATRGSPLHVVAWDFPDLTHPMRDAARLARAAWVRRRSPTHVAAVAPDIETRAEGTQLTGWRVALYLRTLRARLPHDVAILTTVPWPSPSRVGRYPYATVAARSDAVLPMTYWYNNSPAWVTATSILFLRRFHRPVLPVGQGYDGRLDVPWLRHNDLGRQVPAFLATARRLGARAVSLWSWQSAPPVAWEALSWAGRWFGSLR